MTDHEEIASLKAEVAALKRTVTKLTDILVAAGAINDDDRKILLRSARQSFDTDVEPGDAPPAAGSGCAVCGKLLGDDDPDLTRGHASLCAMCFTRG